MRKVLLAFSAILLGTLLYAQQKEGKVMYERTMQIQIQLQDDAMSQMLPKTRTMQMTMDNGKMERKEINDSSMITAWFTTDIPVSAGPEVQGQLPGLILALDINDGRMVYKAIGISPKADLASIKEPTKGKKLTPDEFTSERNKMMDEMQKNNRGNGGNRVIIRN